MKKLGMWSLVIVLAAVAGGALSYKPWKAYLEQRSLAQQQMREMEASEKRSAELARQRAELESNKGQERQARSHGFRKPGEQPVGEL